MTDQSKFNEGIKLVYRSDTNEVGLLYENGAVILRAPFSFISQSYFCNVNGVKEVKLPPIEKGEEHFFLPLQSVLDQQPVPLIGVQKNILTQCTPLENIGAAALNPLDGTGAAALKSHPSPLPAFVRGRGYGLVYSTESSFLADFASLQFFGLVNYNYAPEDKRVTDQNLIFLPMQSVLTGFSKADDASWDPVEIVSLAEVTLYLPALSSSSAPVQSDAAVLSLANLAPKSVSKVTFTNVTNVASASHRTPAGPTVTSCGIAAQRGKGNSGSHSDGSKSYSEGLTTGGTMSTSSGGLGELHSASSFSSSDAPALSFNAGSGRRVLTSSRLHTAPETAHSSPSRSDRSRSECSSLASSPVSSKPAAAAVVNAAKKVAKKAASAPAPAVVVVEAVQVQTTQLRVPGHSDFWRPLDDTRRLATVDRHTKAAEEQRALLCSEFFKNQYPSVMELRGWTKLWSKHSGEFHLSYCTPGSHSAADKSCPLLRDVHLVENLEVFHSKESLYQHALGNPCLLEAWPQLWARLSAAGWQRAEHRQGETAGQTMFYCLGFVHQYHRDRGIASAAGLPSNKKKSAVPSSLQEAQQWGLVPGQHLFVSRAAVMKFVARFPYLLQDDDTFLHTLHEFGWKIEADSNRLLRVQWSEESSSAGPWQFKSKLSWIEAAEVRKRLWVMPTLLYQHLAPALPADALLRAVSLAEGAALLTDVEPPSPQVKGLDRAGRDAAVNNLTHQLAEYLRRCTAAKITFGPQMEQLEETITAGLKQFGWGFKKCAWSSDWWQAERSWQAPWLAQAVKNGEVPMLCRDYFWTLQAVAEYVDLCSEAGPASLLETDFFYSPLVQLPEKFRPAAAAIRACEIEHTNNLILKLVRNAVNNPFEEGPLKDMLLTTGWIVFPDEDAEIVVFVPYWRTKEVNVHNYTTYKANVDYFDTLEDINSHLESFGNKAAHKIRRSPPSSAQHQQTPAQEQARTDATSSSSEAMEVSPASSDCSTIVHLGRAYHVHSAEAGIVWELNNAERDHFPVIFNALRKIGWGTSWIGHDHCYIITPWGFDRNADAFAGNTKKKIADLSLLREGVDYFPDTEVGRVEVLTYLRKRGFVEREADYDGNDEEDEDEEEEYFGEEGEEEEGNEEDMQVQEATEGSQMDVDAGTEASSMVSTSRRTTSSASPGSSAAARDRQVPPEVVAAAAAAAPSPAIFTASEDGSECGVTHLGRHYAAGSPEHTLLAKIFRPKLYFPDIYTLLNKTFLWGIHKVVGFSVPLLVASWALDVEGAFSVDDRDRYKLEDLSLLEENVDYFSVDDEGKAAVVAYLQRYGIQGPQGRILSPPKPFKAGKGGSKKASKKPSAPAALPLSQPTSSSSFEDPAAPLGPVFTAEGVTHAGYFYDAESMEYKFIRNFLFAPTPYFSTIYNALKASFGWGPHYVKGIPEALICASWALEVEEAFSLNSKCQYKLEDLSLLEENVDYFHDNQEGKKALIAYLQVHGIRGPKGRISSPPKPVASPPSKPSPKAVKALVARAGVAKAGVEQQHKKRKAESPPRVSSSPPASPQQGSRDALALAEEQRRTRRGRGSLDPTSEVCPAFADDWQKLRLLLQNKKLVLTTKADAPSELWTALVSINRNWRCFLDATGNTVFTRAPGCNDTSCDSKFTEGVDFFRSQNAFWRFIQQQYALHLDSHSLVSLEEIAERKEKKSAPSPEQQRPRSRANSVHSGRNAPKGDKDKDLPHRHNHNHKAPEEMDVEHRFNHLTIHKRSPPKACYRSRDPSLHMDRLVAGVASPADLSEEEEEGQGQGQGSESEDEEEYFSRRNLAFAAESSPPAMARAAYDVDMQEVLGDFLRDSPQQGAASSKNTQEEEGDEFENDTDYLPLTQQQQQLQQQELDEPSIESLLSAEHPPFQRILQLLGWTYNYTSGLFLPNGEPTGGVSTVYLRPGCSLHTVNMIKGEDYFLTEESLIDYLRVQFGLQAMPQYVSNSKKPRATRSGRVIDGTEGPAVIPSAPATGGVPRSAHSSPVVTTAKTAPGSIAKKPTSMGDVLVGEKRSRAASHSQAAGSSSDATNPVGASPKRIRHRSESNDSSSVAVSSPSAAPSPSSSSSSSVRTGPLCIVPSQLGLPLDQAAKTVQAALMAAGKQSAYSAGIHSRDLHEAPLGREKEFAHLLSMVTRSLATGQGSAAYLCGSPGMGKTHTAVAVLDAIAQSRRNALASPSPASASVDLGYNVVWLCGSALKLKNGVFSAIAERLKLPAPSSSSSQSKLSNSASGRSPQALMLFDRFGAPAVPVELSNYHTEHTASERMDCDETTAALPEPAIRRTSSSGSVGTGSGRHHSSGKAVPMTVVVIDELDMAHQDSIGQLLQLATCAPSSLVVIGLGNTINYTYQIPQASHSAKISSVEQIVFEPYLADKLVVILDSLTGGLFNSKASTFLANKICRNNKGDVRSLLKLAEVSLQKATLKLKPDGIATEVVSMQHVTEACPVEKDPSVEVLEALPPLTVRLLVSMFKYEAELQKGDFTLANIARAFSDYKEQKQVHSESSPALVHDWLTTLQNYSLVKVVPIKKVPVYLINVSIEVMLSANLGEVVHAELLVIKNNAIKRAAAASMTQV